MSDKILTDRQSYILNNFLLNKSYALSDIGQMFALEQPSPATLRRDLTNLCEQRYLIQTGSRKSARHLSYRN